MDKKTLAYTGSLPITILPVTAGGTGNTSLALNQILVGNGSSALTFTSAGTTGQLLISTPSANPFYGSTATNNFTFQQTTAGTAETFTLQQTDLTTNTDHSSMNISVGGTTGGNAWTQYSVGTSRSYAFGVNNIGTIATNSPSEASSGLWISTNNSGSVNPNTGTAVWEMTKNGARIMPGQSAFLFTVNTTYSNVTGDNSIYTVVFDTTVFDQNTNFSLGTSLFTAPVTGNYWLAANIALSGIASNQTTGVFQIQTGTPARTYICNNQNTFNLKDANGITVLNIFSFVNMTGGATASVQIQVGSGSKSVNVIGTPTMAETFFTGYLVC